MLYEHTGYEKSGLETEQLWDACEFSSLEAKELGEQVCNTSKYTIVVLKHN